MANADTIPSQATPIRWKRPNGSSRCIACSRTKGPERVSYPAVGAERSGLPRRRRTAVHGQHALHQHDPGRQAAALSRQSRDRTPHQEPHSLERHGHGRAGQQASTTASAGTSPPSPRRPRSTKSASTTSSAARATTTRGDQIYFQGHASPGIYARAFLEGRLSEKQLENFRHELRRGGGLS